MKFANVRLSWDVTIQVPVSDLSKVLDMLNKYPFLKDEYDNNDHYYVVANKDVRVDLTDKEPESCKRADKAQLKAA
jgi:uncharacterized protein (DUF1697 family)